MKKHIVSVLLLLSIIIPSSVFAEQYYSTSTNSTTSTATTPTNVSIDLPTSSCVSLAYNLKYQSRDTFTNGEVSTLQDFLQARGYVTFEPTGYFGLSTVAGVKAFQIANGLTADGSVGPMTRAKINAMTCGGGTTTTTTTNTSSGCYTGTIFSTTTGQRCPCPAGYMFSPTTGQACSLTTREPFHIIYPSGGETFYTGKTYEIKWGGFDGYDITSYDVFLYKNGNSYLSLGKAPVGERSLGIFRWKVPSDISGGIYTIRFSGKAAGGMSQQFNIVQASNDSNNSNGCSPGWVFSPITGERCGGSNNNRTPIIDSVSPATISQQGQLTVYGSYLANSTVIFDNGNFTGGGVPIVPTSSTDTTLKFLVPYNATPGTHTVRLSKEGAGTSNGVNIKVERPIAYACTTEGFDPGTGFRCGCTSNSGWSSTTGQSCATAERPLLNVVSPNGGEVVDISQPVNVSLRSNLPYPIKHYITLSDETTGKGYSLDSLQGSYGVIFSEAQINQGTQSVSFYIPSSWNLNLNDRYKIEICADNVCDKSNSTFTLRRTSATALEITTSSNLPTAKVGQLYSATLNTSGGDSSNGFNWSVNGGAASFPVTGLGLGQYNSNSTNITGIPAKIYVNGLEQTTPYTFSFFITATSGSQTTSKQFSLTVESATAGSNNPVINNFSATPSSVAIGAPATLNISASNANSCFVGGFASAPVTTGTVEQVSEIANPFQATFRANNSGTTAGNVSGTITITPMGTNSYTLNCLKISNGTGYSTTQTITVPVFAY